MVGYLFFRHDSRSGRVSQAELKVVSSVAPITRLYFLITVLYVKYREIAPARISDQALIELIRKNNKNDGAIKEAIQMLWNGIIPTYSFQNEANMQLAEEETAPSESDWITTGGKKKKKVCS